MQHAKPVGFQKKVLQHILLKRNVLPRSQHSHLEQFFPKKNTSTARTNNSGSNIWFYDLDEFQAHAKEHWKVDKAKSERMNSANVNDKIRLFSIAGRSENRDELLKIGIGKHTTREDCDYA